MPGPVMICLLAPTRMPRSWFRVRGRPWPDTGGCRLGRRMWVFALAQHPAAGAQRLFCRPVSAGVPLPAADRSYAARGKEILTDARHP
jgi:hypothetical protein